MAPVALLPLSGRTTSRRSSAPSPASSSRPRRQRPSTDAWSRSCLEVCRRVEGFAMRQGRGASRGRHEPSEDRLPARPLREDLDARARPGRARRTPGRGRRQRARHGQGHRPLVGGDVPDLPAASARRAARRRSGDRDRRAAGVSPAHAAEAGAAAQDWRGVAALPVRGVLVSVAQPRQPARSSLP